MTETLYGSLDTRASSPHWLPGVTLLTGSTGFRLTTPPCVGSFVLVCMHSIVAHHFCCFCQHHRTSTPRILNSRFMCLEFLRSSSNCRPPHGWSATFGLLIVLTRSHHDTLSPRGINLLGWPTMVECLIHPCLRLFPILAMLYVIEHLHEEFTSVCPKTGHPDFGEICSVRAC